MHNKLGHSTLTTCSGDNIAEYSQCDPQTDYMASAFSVLSLSIHSWMDDRQLDLLTPSLLEGRPNMYTFTKALAEYLLINEAKGLPLAIYRPSIVGGAYREPYPGWVDCIHGPSSLFVAVSDGGVMPHNCHKSLWDNYLPSCINL